MVRCCGGCCSITVSSSSPASVGGPGKAFPGPLLHLCLRVSGAQERRSRDLYFIFARERRRLGKGVPRTSTFSSPPRKASPGPLLPPRLAPASDAPLPPGNVVMIWPDTGSAPWHG
ncbi:hypothetical protein BS78_05G155700 [Paspalum vaginatum]|nr:hypothetical protein BS78_05G155700 [Paspalum vaginatum]